MNNYLFLPFAFCIVPFLVGEVTRAATFTEIGNAGELLSTSQAVSTQPPGTPLTSILGIITAGEDIDLFQIYVNGVNPFSVTTVGTGTTIDTQLFLFNSAGIGIFGNDDDAGTPQSTIPSTLLSAGVYYLAISTFGDSPISAGGEIFPSPLLGVQGPTGAGGASPLSAWFRDSFDDNIGTYTINLTGAEFTTGSTPVPYEPHSALGVLVLGIWGAVSSFKKTRKLASKSCIAGNTSQSGQLAKKPEKQV
ncbi:DVUA0089 family protein [Funiculus sociatus GB2-A5]|uniref:DVUA0089 family protein n=1 Tax=Funiculus sociatus GB2-A5 TaxID=2933946 RepID=A0ABV0JRD1_9CYAN|nr:DVUA0089 family protein [Trichocoleus sp. FACHB-6]